MKTNILLIIICIVLFIQKAHTQVAAINVNLQPGQTFF